MSSLTATTLPPLSTTTTTTSTSCHHLRRTTATRGDTNINIIHTSGQPTTQPNLHVRASHDGTHSAPVRHERSPLGRPESWALQQGRSLSATYVSSTSSSLLLEHTTAISPSSTTKDNHNDNEEASKNNDNIVSLVQKSSEPMAISSGQALFLASPSLNRRRGRSASWGYQQQKNHHLHRLPAAAAAFLSRSSINGEKTTRHHNNGNKWMSTAAAREKAEAALRINNSMVYLDGPYVYSCQQCRTHLTSHDDIISKSFHGRHGRAFLFHQAVNTTQGPPEDRMLMTGLHTVRDIFCNRCRTLIGWTYEKAFEASQKYKEGKFIIEKINLFQEISDYYEPQPTERNDWKHHYNNCSHYTTTMMTMKEPSWSSSWGHRELSYLGRPRRVSWGDEPWSSSNNIDGNGVDLGHRESQRRHSYDEYTNNRNNLGEGELSPLGTSETLTGREDLVYEYSPDDDDDDNNNQEEYGEATSSPLVGHEHDGVDEMDES